MGAIFADLELINNEDITLAKRYIIGEDEVKRMMVNIRVDTGSDMLCIRNVD